MQSVPESPHSPPVTSTKPVRPVTPTMTVLHENGQSGEHSDPQLSGKVSADLEKKLESLVVDVPESHEEAQVLSPTLPSSALNQSKFNRKPRVNQPVAPQDDAETMVANDQSTQSPSTEDIQPLDWEDFETRYLAAVAAANTKEQDLMADFDSLMKYFAVWADASFAQDDHRALKRIRTRSVYVQHSEQVLQAKKQHHAQVVQAFAKALALLRG